MHVGTGTELTGSIARINRLRAIERELVYTLSQLIIETPEYATKIHCGVALHQHARAVDAWNRRLAELGEQPAESARAVERPSTELLTYRRLRAYLDDGLGVLSRLLQAYPESGMTIADQPSVLLAGRRLSEIREMETTILSVIEATSASRVEGVSGIWSDRVYQPPRRPARDPVFACDRQPINPFDEALPVREAAAQFMHMNLTDLELTTIELCSLFILKGPDLPWDFTCDMARQIWDETRHARMFHDRLLELGSAPGIRPTSMTHWDISSGQPLPVAMTCHQLIGEWSGVDAAIYLGDYFRERGDDRTAAIFDFVARDEITHVGFGNKWVAWLAPNDADRDEVRARAEAAREAHGKPATGPLNFPLNRWACELSRYPERYIRKLEANYECYGSRQGRR